MVETTLIRWPDDWIRIMPRLTVRTPPDKVRQSAVADERDIYHVDDGGDGGVGGAASSCNRRDVI